ncbi:MAG: type II secretion system F family protein [bacterium]
MNIKLRQFFAVAGEMAVARFGQPVASYVRNHDAMLISAGQPGGLMGVELLGIQVVAMLLFPVIWGLLLFQMGIFDFLFEGPKQILVYLGLMMGGFIFPAANIGERAARRKQSIALELPDTLDLLTISVEAGLDFLTALRRVVEKHRAGPLKDELSFFFNQIELGRPRRDALREMASRVKLQDLSAVVSSLIQADRLGASIGPVLKVQSDMLRIRRAQRAEKAAQEAPVKMLAPLVLCIMPAVFLMILAPVFIQMITSYAK